MLPDEGPETAEKAVEVFPLETLSRTATNTEPLVGPDPVSAVIPVTLFIAVVRTIVALALPDPVGRIVMAPPLLPDPLWVRTVSAT